MSNSNDKNKKPKAQKPLSNKLKEATKLAHIGRPSVEQSTSVNPIVKRASTLLFKKAEDLYRTDIPTYGRAGTDSHEALQSCFNVLEGGAGTTLTPSGLSACTLAILANVKSGDHILLSDSIYGPTRNFCLGYLANMGVQAQRYRPQIGSDISQLIRKNTSMILMESPGSLTLEVQDVPAICEVAKAHNITTFIDNTWSAGITLKPLSLGCDISIQAATKYIGGHSDLLFGAVISRTPEMAKRIAQTSMALGMATSPDDAYQILRGFRTLTTRFWAQEKTSYKLAKWLETRPEVLSVRHPALESHPEHKIWKRDFTGGGGLFSIILKPVSEDLVFKFVNKLKLFGTGFSFGGYESVVIHCNPQLNREFTSDFGGPLVRFGCGLEDHIDLKNDIKQALKVLS